MSATDGWTQMRGPSPATARTCTHARTLARACTHKHTHAHICTCTHAHSHARTGAHAHARTYTHARAHTHTQARTHDIVYRVLEQIRSVTQRWCVGESRLRIPTTDNDAVALAVHDIVIQPRACEALAARRRLQGKALGTSGVLGMLWIAKALWGSSISTMESTCSLKTKLSRLPTYLRARS